MEDYFDTPMVRRRFEEVTSTQSPTDLSTQQKSSSSNNSSYANRNSNRNSNSSTDVEPVLSTGEKVGAFIFGSITLMIVIYFLMLPIQPFGKSKRRQRRGRSRRGRSPPGRRRPHGIAEREDELEEKATLTMLREDNLHSDIDGNNGMATVPLSSPTKHDDSEDSSKASTIEMASVYSLSSDDGSPARTSARSALNEYAKKSISLTSVVLNAILPTASKDEENTENYYVKHDDKDNENDEDGSESTNSNISSPFHPSPTPRTTPPRFQRKKNKTFFISNDDSGVCKTTSPTSVTGVTNTRATATNDEFAVISGEEQPFDCETDQISDNERPFDCVA